MRECSICGRFIRSLGFANHETKHLREQKRLEEAFRKLDEANLEFNLTKRIYSGRPSCCVYIWHDNKCKGYVRRQTLDVALQKALEKFQKEQTL